MNKKLYLTKSGIVDLDTLTIKFGGAFSKPENIFTANLIKIPDYTFSYKERESLGGGWYGGMETVTSHEKYLYAVVHNNIFRGFVRAYGDDSKQNVFLLDKKIHKFVYKFLNTQSNLIIP